MVGREISPLSILAPIQYTRRMSYWERIKYGTALFLAGMAICTAIMAGLVIILRGIIWLGDQDDIWQGIVLMVGVWIACIGFVGGFEDD
jgi:hypothetical protein